MKKRILILICFCCFTGLCLGQKKNIDSLQQVLKTAKDDTAKVNTLNVLAQEFYNNKPDTAIYFANKALVLAIKLNDKMGIANAHYTFGKGLYYLENYTEALKNFNDALKLYEELFTSATTSFKSKILKEKGKTYSSIGLVNYDQANYTDGLKNFFTALRIYQEIGDKRGIVKIYNNIGNIYKRQGNYAEALKNFFAALKPVEELGNKGDKAYILTNIGIIYKQQGNDTEALKNYFTALKIDEELGNKRQKAGNLTNIGNVYIDLGNYAEALKIFFTALKLNEELGNKQWKAVNLNNIGVVYDRKKNYAEALENYFVALKIVEEIGDKDKMANCFNDIGNDYLRLKKNNKASWYLNKGLSLAKEIGNLSIIKDSYKVLAKLDSVQGNFKKSLENYKMYIAYRDSLINEESTKKMMQIQMQYEFDKKESLAKAEQEKKDALALKELQKQKLLRNGFVGGLAVLLIFVVIISIIMRQREKIRLIKKERNRISRELHDDIGAELTRITVISQNLQKKTNKDDEMQEKLGKISEAGKKVLGSIGEIIWTMNPQKNNLENIFAYIRRYVSEYLEMSGIEVNIEFPDEIPANSVSDEYRRNIFLVIKEAIYNITKHSKATRVRVSMKFRKRLARTKRFWVIEQRDAIGLNKQFYYQHIKIKGEKNETSKS